MQVWASGSTQEKEPTASPAVPSRTLEDVMAMDVGMASQRFRRCQPLIHAVVSLTKSRCWRDGDAELFGGDFGRAPGALKIGTVGRSEYLAGQTRTHRACLCLTHRVEADVDMPLQALFGVPVGLAVANNAEAGSHERQCLNPAENGS